MRCECHGARGWYHCLLLWIILRWSWLLVLLGWRDIYCLKGDLLLQLQRPGDRRWSSPQGLFRLRIAERVNLWALKLLAREIFFDRLSFPVILFDIVPLLLRQLWRFDISLKLRYWIRGSWDDPTISAQIHVQSCLVLHISYVHDWWFVALCQKCEEFLVVFGAIFWRLARVRGLMFCFLCRLNVSILSYCALLYLVCDLSHERSHRRSRLLPVNLSVRLSRGFLHVLLRIRIIIVTLFLWRVFWVFLLTDGTVSLLIQSVE